ncbi:hypothetical protein HMPREF9248_0900 [Fannyhessea vaginae PB189-T1-4]|uniref:Uncharacterized protein n=1 Tax=Fannyhessea vaginae PB189-T1-4 TaxID=866774 RepID=A0ABN0B098_9ACTN|nr:hypothetical protein HMPREF9248_0900 [Fannyhessea vaginae PB189-T1-4]
MSLVVYSSRTAFVIRVVHAHAHVHAHIYVRKFKSSIT